MHPASLQNATLFNIGLGVASMPAPSGDPASDTARLGVEQARATRYIEHQDGIYRKTSVGMALNDGQELVGHGAGRTTWLATLPDVPESAGFFSASEKADLGIDGITFDYAGLHEPHPGWAVLAFRNIAKVRLRDIDIVNFPRFGLAVNGGSHFTYQWGRLTRAIPPLARDGSQMSFGSQNQAILVSESANPCSRFVFSDIYSRGSGHDVSGSHFRWTDCEVDGIDFGSAFTTEQASTCHHQEFVRCKAHGGRGTDSNNTVIGSFEIWSPRSLVHSCESWDMDGYALTLGGRNSRVIANTWGDIGRLPTAGGVSLLHVLNGAYSASGSLLAANTYERPDGVTAWNAPVINFSTLSDELAVSLQGEQTDNYIVPGFPSVTRWSSPGALVAVARTGFKMTANTRAIASTSVPGLRRSRHDVVGATFVGTDGAGLPAGLKLSAVVENDNEVAFYLVSLLGMPREITLPSGTYYARVITVR